MLQTDVGLRNFTGLDIKLTWLGLARLDNEPALLGSARYLNELEGQLGSVR